MNLSGIVSDLINYIAYKRGYFRVPWYLSRIVGLPMCDNCEGNHLNPRLPYLVQHKVVKLPWMSERRLVYVYKHETFEQCKENRRLWKVYRKKHKIKLEKVDPMLGGP